MLNCNPYNLSMTDDIKVAILNRDVDFFHQEIKRLSSNISANGIDVSCKFDPEVSRLMICLAMLDGLVFRGETTQFICDVVNF
jgi:hypothetical protein